MKPNIVVHTQVKKEDKGIKCECVCECVCVPALDT